MSRYRIGTKVVCESKYLNGIYEVIICLGDRYIIQNKNNSHWNVSSSEIQKANKKQLMQGFKNG